MSKRILVIEDNQDIAEMYELILSEEGYRVDLRYTGESGVARAQEDSYDLILLDVMLPGINGISVLKKLRAHETTQHVPVFILTALNQPVVQKQALDAGAIEVLIKSSFTPDQLVAKVKQVLIESETNTDNV